MPTVVRSFDIPLDSPGDAVETLAYLLASLPQRQQRLADQVPAVAVAQEVRRRADKGPAAIEITYATRSAASLLERIAGPRPEPAELANTALQLCAAFAGTYSAGSEAPVRHGGLCSAAVLVGGEAGIEILDFGVAECFLAIGEPGGESWVEQVCECVAPEVWKNPGRFSQASDVFAAGVLLYQFATGIHPFGAIRNDPDDCKHQILVEVPVPPRQRAAQVPEGLSAIIFKAIRGEPQQRYNSFQDMHRALSEWAGRSSETAAAPGPSRPPVPAAGRTPAPDPLAASEPGVHPAIPAAAGEEEQARQRYLEEQARLKEERAQAQQRLEELQKVRGEQQARRREQAAKIKSKLRQHAVLAACAALLLVIAAIAGLSFARRTMNARAVRAQLDALTAAITRDLQHGDATAVAKALGLNAASQQLQRAIDDLRMLDPQARFAINQIKFTGAADSIGTADVAVGEHGAPMTFRLDDQRPGGLELKLDESQLVAAIGQFAGGLAQRDLTAVPGLVDLMRRIQAACQAPCTAQLAGQRLGELLAAAGRDDPRPLGYLAAHGGAKQVSLGSFRKVRGDDALRSELLLATPAGEPILDSPAYLLFQYRCNSDPLECVLSRAEVEPAAEPDAHKRWCVQQTVDQLRTAFAARDAGRLAALTDPEDREAITLTLDWAAQCRQAELQCSDPTLTGSRAQLQARIHYTPGILNERSFSADAVLGFELDGTAGWLVRPGIANNWPPPPLPLLRQQRGRDLLGRLQQAFEQQNPEMYAAIFDRSKGGKAMAEMFAKIAADAVNFDIRGTEDDHDPGMLYIEISARPSNPAAGTHYPERRYGFELQDGVLRWDGRGDPLWSFPGLKYTMFAERFAGLTWDDSLDELKRDFERNGAADMADTEAQSLARSIAAVDEARRIFEPASKDYTAGLPQRVRLRTSSEAPGMVFRLVAVDAEVPYLMYMLEREVAVPDLGRFWQRADQPWEMWAQAVGPPPNEQAVGLTLEEAEAFARANNCRLPTIREWESAALRLGATPDAPGDLNFYGGVWELCRGDPDAGDGPAIVGGSWIDHDPAIAGTVAAGVARRPLEDPAFRFGTVGFRLCKPLDIAPDLIGRAVSPPPDPQAKEPQS